MPTPLRVELSGSLSLPLPAAQAFEPFTPEGERCWVEGWEPEYLQPAHPSTDIGTMFRTRHGGEETIWIVLTYRPPMEARYARLTPGSRIGTVHVRCEGQGDDATTIHVTYHLTAVAPAGEEVLRAMTPEAYARMLQEWREAILRSVGRNGPR